jgi:putative ABC transport system substrate-binding protein
MPSPLTFAVALAVSGAAALGWTAAGQELKTVAVTAIVEHPALDAARRGIKDELAAAGYEEGHNLDFLFESAGGSPTAAAQIARRFVLEAPDVIVAISTPSAQAVVSATREIPVVFTAVTDPVGAGLVPNPERPGGNVTGISDRSPIGPQLDLIREIAPGARRLGVIYNPGEPNAVALVELIRQAAPGRNLAIVEAAAPRAADVLAAAQSLVGNVDATYVPTDNTVVAALEAVIEVGTDHRLPVFAGDTNAVPRGAIAALGFNYYDLGRQTGKIVARVLAGADPGDIPVEGVQMTELYVNPGAAAAMGLRIPPAMLARAKVVVE